MRLVTQSGGEPNCTECQGRGHNSWANVRVTASARHGARSDAPQLRRDTSPYVSNVVGEAFFITAMISVPDANHFDPARLPRPSKFTAEYVRAGPWRRPADRVLPPRGGRLEAVERMPLTCLGVKHRRRLRPMRNCRRDEPPTQVAPPGRLRWICRDRSAVGGRRTLARRVKPSWNGKNAPPLRIPRQSACSEKR